MPDSYPLPHYAASIWMSGDKIMLSLPATRGGKAHTITLPATEHGGKVLLDVLRERSREGYEPTIGTKAAPVQYDIDKILVRMMAPTARELKKDAPQTLSLGDLDL